MKNKILLLTILVSALFSCKQENQLKKTDLLFINRRDLITNDPALKVKPAFIPLSPGAVKPEGWIKDWAVDAANGITGHLDEWSIAFNMAWKGVGFDAEGVDPETGMGWPLEQASYWMDGAIRLAYIMNDTALINKISERLDMVVDGVLNGGDSFIYWQDVDFSKTNFDNWAHSHMGRALVAYYEATGNPRILDALVKVYGNFELVPLTFHTNDVSGSNNVDAMLDTYEMSGDKRILDAVLKMANAPLTKETVGKWNNEDIENGHGVIFYENLRVPAMIYPWNNDPAFLKATQSCFNWLDKKHMQPYGVASSEEHNAGKGSTRNSETCNVATSAWSYQQLYEITGNGELGDRIEKVFFNAAATPVSRDFKTMCYFQSPDRIEGLMPHDMPGHPADRGESSYVFRPTGHKVLCCVGNLNRVIPNYVMHMWMGTLDKGLAATLYGPSVVNAIVGQNTPVEIISNTNYPFSETIEMTVKPAESISFPLYLRIPSWCSKPEIRVNDETINIDPSSGFVKIDRKWKQNDKIELKFPMHIEVLTAHETPYPQTKYFQEGSSAGRALAKITDVNSPYRSILYGPLLFALPVKDIDPNRQAENQKWNYAMVTEDATTVDIERSQMPERWSWQIEEAPVRLKVKAKTFDWKPTELLPLPKEEVEGTDETEITLVPYGCTKFRISMFPIAKK